MKYLNFLGIVTLVSVLAFGACKKDDKTTPDKKFTPSDFKLIEPNGDVGVDLNPVLKWEESLDPRGEGVSYDVYLDKDEQPTSKVASGLSSTTFKVDEDLDFETKYFWKVVATNKQGESTNSKVASFTTKKEDEKEAPTSFGLIEPTNGAEDVSLKPILKWEESTDPNGGSIAYDVYFGKNENPTTKVESNLSATSFTIADKLEFSTTYYWKVVAKNDAGKSTDSETGSFVTEHPLPATAFKLKSPVAQKDVDLKPVLEWDESTDPNGGSISYDIYIGKTKEPTNLIKSDHRSTSYAITEELESTTMYYWKVVAKNSYGESIESPIASFATKATLRDKLIGKWNWEELFGDFLTPCSQKSSHDFQENGVLIVTTFPDVSTKCPARGNVEEYTFDATDDGTLKTTRVIDGRTEIINYTYSIFEITGRGSYLLISRAGKPYMKSQLRR